MSIVSIDDAECNRRLLNGTYGPASGYLNTIGPGYPVGPAGDAQRAKDIAEKEAYQARDLAYGKLDTAIAVIRQFGTTVDVEQAGKAIAKIAAKAMRRRA